MGGTGPPHPGSGRWSVAFLQELSAPGGRWRPPCCRRRPTLGTSNGQSHHHPASCRPRMTVACSFVWSTSA